MGSVTGDAAKSAIRVAVARAVADALITGIDNCAEEGRALTQVQQTDMTVMAVLAAHEAIQQAERNVDTETLLLDEIAGARG